MRKDEAMLELQAVVPPGAGPGHGECFLWQRNQEPTLCVDAGGTRATGAAAARKFPQVLVLSHDDHDHIGGAETLITNAATSLKELWAPVEWLFPIQGGSRGGASVLG